VSEIQPWCEEYFFFEGRVRNICLVDVIAIFFLKRVLPLLFRKQQVHKSAGVTSFRKEQQHLFYYRIQISATSDSITELG